MNRCFFASVRWAGGLCLAGALAGCGTMEPAHLETRYGEAANSTNRILVVYATRAGSTAEVADFVGKTLAKNGACVDVSPVASVKNLDGYSAVVMGSGVWGGKPYSEVVEFAKRHRGALKDRPTACFLVCMTVKENTPENRKTAEAYAAPLRAELALVDVGLFAGKMDYAKLGFLPRFAAKRIANVPEGDFRDWKAIEAWATALSSNTGFARIVRTAGGWRPAAIGDAGARN